MPGAYKDTQKYCSRPCYYAATSEEKRAWGLHWGNLPPIVTAETRRKQSVAMSKRLASSTYTKGVGGHRKDIGHYVRSRWEANIARILIHEGLSYQFEPDIFVLINNEDELRYRPDFKVQGRYIEVKGWWNERSTLIRTLMSVQYPNIKIEYIDEPIYEQLQGYYAKHIPEWEQKGVSGRLHGGCKDE
jgi:hypothetical protein